MAPINKDGIKKSISAEQAEIRGIEILSTANFGNALTKIFIKKINKAAPREKLKIIF